MRDDGSRTLTGLHRPTAACVLRFSADLHDTGDVQAIDATGFDRHSASHHYANRTTYTFGSVETTALIDCETSGCRTFTAR